MLNSILGILLAITVGINSNVEQFEPHKARATAYCLQGITASGEEVREGICATGNEEYFGKTIMMYQRKEDGLGDFIGVYECLDTGCSKDVIDVWCKDLDSCQEFMDKVYENGCQGKVYIFIIEDRRDF